MKKLLKSTVLVIVTLIFSVIFMEYTLNFTEIILPTFVITNAKEGDVLEPNAEVAYFAEGFAMNRVNSLGYWGKEYSTERKPGKLRIALLGDSYVEALQVQPGHHFGVILGKELQKLTGLEVEVLNFGRSGQSFREMYITYELNAKNYHPDFTLFFVQDQDFMRKGPEGGPRVFLNEENKIEFTNFEKSPIYENRKKMEDFKKFSTYSLFRNVVKMVQSGQSDEILLDKFDFIKTDDELRENKDSLMYKRKDPFYNLNKAIYSKLAKYELESNSKILTVAIESMPNNYKNLIEDYSYLIDLQPPLQKFESEKKIDPTYWEVTNTRGHWNYEGHKFVGKYLSERIFDLIKSIPM